MIRKKRGKDMEEEKEMLLRAIPAPLERVLESFGGWEGTGVAKMNEWGSKQGGK